jgi:2-polyprenyl-3-methyl-5-hydroxy-6-metoxy-1,4-benzoquinol methylase
MNFVPCPLCSSTQLRRAIYIDPRVTDKNENSTLDQCTNCSHIFVNPYKPQDYLDVPIEIFDCDLQENSKDRFNFFYEQFMAYYGKPPGRMLELGCGMGHFLLKAKSSGWQVEGVEPSSKVADWARRKHAISVHNAYFDDLTLPNDYDCVVAIEVLEHVINPREFIYMAYEKLKRPGFLYLTTPNMDCKKMRNDQAKAKWHTWPAMIPFGHLHYFTPGVLMDELMRAGFKVITMVTQTGDHDDEQITAACHKL